MFQLHRTSQREVRDVLYHIQSPRRVLIPFFLLRLITTYFSFLRALASRIEFARSSLRSEDLVYEVDYAGNSLSGVSGASIYSIPLKYWRTYPPLEFLQ